MHLIYQFNMRQYLRHMKGKGSELPLFGNWFMQPAFSMQWAPLNFHHSWAFIIKALLIMNVIHYFCAFITVSELKLSSRLTWPIITLSECILLLLLTLYLETACCIKYSLLSQEEFFKINKLRKYLKHFFPHHMYIIFTSLLLIQITQLFNNYWIVIFFYISIFSLF